MVGVCVTVDVCVAVRVGVLVFVGVNVLVLVAVNVAVFVGVNVLVLTGVAVAGQLFATSQYSRPAPELKSQVYSSTDNICLKINISS